MFVRGKILIQIYSNIRSYRNFDTNIFGYSFVSNFLRMSHSVMKLMVVMEMVLDKEVDVEIYQEVDN